MLVMRPAQMADLGEVQRLAAGQSDRCHFLAG